MRRIAILLIAAASSILLAGTCAWAQRPSCTDQYCPPPQPCRRPGPARCEEQVEVGAYSTPPATGVQAGESNPRGLELGAIRIPAMNFELPTIQLPNFLSMRRNPRMFVDSAVAAYDARPPVPHGPLMNAQVGPALVQPNVEEVAPASTEELPACNNNKSNQAINEVRKLKDERDALNEQLKRQKECIEEFERCIKEIRTTQQQINLYQRQLAAADQNTHTVRLPPVGHESTYSNLQRTLPSSSAPSAYRAPLATQSRFRSIEEAFTEPPNSYSDPAQRRPASLEGTGGRERSGGEVQRTGFVEQSLDDEPRARITGVRALR